MKKVTLIIFQRKHEYFQIMYQLGTTYLEYPSSELRGLAHVAVRLDRIEWAGSTWLVRNDNPWVVPCIVGLGSFIHGYSFFGSSPLFSFSISSCKTARIMTALQQKVECKFIWEHNLKAVNECTGCRPGPTGIQVWLHIKDPMSNLQVQVLFPTRDNDTTPGMWANHIISFYK